MDARLAGLIKIFPRAWTTPRTFHLKGAAKPRWDIFVDHLHGLGSPCYMVVGVAR